MTSLGVFLFGGGFTLFGSVLTALYYRTKVSDLHDELLRVKWRFAVLRSICLAKGMKLDVLNDEGSLL